MTGINDLIPNAQTSARSCQTILWLIMQTVIQLTLQFDRLDKFPK